MVVDVEDVWDREEFEAYIRWWSDALAELLFWTESQIADWIGRQRVHFTTECSIMVLCTETPAYYIVDDLTPNAVREQVAANKKESYEQYAERICNAIEGDSGLAFYEEAATDWAACRERVNAVLGEFGYSLPEVDHGQ